MHLEQFFTDNAGASIACFVVFTLLVCGLATIMTKFAVAIKDKAKISDGVIGGILIGAITSIPELITSIAVIVESSTDETVHASSVFGDVIGSNMFCFLIMAVVLLATVVMFKHREANQINTASLVFMIVGTIFCFMAGIFDNNGFIYSHSHLSPLVWHGFNFFTIFIFLSYAMAVFSMLFGTRVTSHGIVGKGLKAKVKLPAAQKTKPSKLLQLKMPILIILLIVSVVLLTVSSIILGTSCSGIIAREELGEVFGRTLLLGMATSLPELVAVVTLAVNRRYNMVIDSMVGSCAFNMTILFIANIVYSGLYVSAAETHPMYILDPDTVIQLILFLLEAIFLVLYLVMNSRSVKQYLSTKQTIVINSILLSLTVLSYLIYIVLGTLEQFNIIPY